MLETYMQQEYYRKFGNGSEMVVANIFLRYETESDLIRFLKSGYVEEIEIKTSVADFKNDFKKTVRVKSGVKRVFGKHQFDIYYNKNKHQALIDGELHPNRFYFYVPFYIADQIKELLPDYAGLYILDHSGRIREEKRAKLIHKEKISDNLKYKTARKYVFKFWNNPQQTPDYVGISRAITRLFNIM